MPSWNDLLTELTSLPNDKKHAWITGKFDKALSDVARIRGDRNVILSVSGFLQKQGVPPQLVSISHEDINGFMAAMYGMDFSKGLTLILHTPGGDIGATETIVGYLLSKFEDIEIVVPTYAMSAGTMMCLAAQRIIMGRQSQLGPIDAQLLIGGRSVSAGALRDEFQKAKEEILLDKSNALVWAPILQTMGMGLVQTAENALAYGEKIAAEWLAQHMFAGKDDPERLAKNVAEHFSSVRTHKSHGKRIDRDEARAHGLVVEDLEDDQELQDAVLTAYHLATITFEQSPATKFVRSTSGGNWVKNMVATV